MTNLAQIVLDGNLTADPEMKKTPTNKVVTIFRVATNHEWGGKDGNKSVSYVPIECWDKLAENCNQFLHKGSKVTIQGELREDRWTDTQGVKRSKLKVVARNVRFDTFEKSKNDKNYSNEKYNEKQKEAVYN